MQVEAFITHNGDLDFFTVHSRTYPLADVQALLTHLLGSPMPSEVDSACIAGLLDLLRTRGLWLASVRFGYVYGALATAGNLTSLLPSLHGPKEFAQLASLFDREWCALLPAHKRVLALSHVRAVMCAQSCARSHVRAGCRSWRARQVC